MAVLLWLVIMAFRAVNDTSVVAALFTVANYTYGPLLGLFGVGMFTRSSPRAALIPFVCIGGPVLGYLLEQTVLAVWLQLWLCIASRQRVDHSRRFGLDFLEEARLIVLATA